MGQKVRVFFYCTCFRTAIDSLSNETAASLIATDPRHSIKRRFLIVCVWFFSTLAGAVFLPNISIAIHYLGALAASFIFIFPGMPSSSDVFLNRIFMV